MDLLPLLVHNLMDPDDAVRLFTAAALRKLTGLDFGYKPHGTEADRRAAVDRWNVWLELGSTSEPARGSVPAAGGS
jgi:hypothetical protein